MFGIPVHWICCAYRTYCRTRAKSHVKFARLLFSDARRLRRCRSQCITAPRLICTRGCLGEIAKELRRRWGQANYVAMGMGLACSCGMSTTDSTTTIEELKAKILAFTKERDWEQFHAPKNLSMALSAEAAELMEHFLWVEPEASKARAQEPGRRQDIEDELADIVVYALEFANMTGIDVAAAIDRKMAANAKKYPVEKARGRSEKYTEL